MRFLLIFVSFLYLLPQAYAQPSPAAFAFVLWGEGADGNPVAMARAIVERATACPVLQRASGAWQGMTPRERPPGGHFEQILVCETLYPLGEAAAVLVDGRRLELPVVSTATPRRVLLMGDSGCRGEVEHNPQPCSGDGFTKVWPFGVIAENEERLVADLIIHAGDYNYRNTPLTMELSARVTGYGRRISVKAYDVGDLDDEEEGEFPIGPGYWSQNMQGSLMPDDWPPWREDFFRPAARLMKKAPWLFVRGNHELCSRAGPGWFYLLDSGSALLGGGRGQESCPPQTPADWRPGAWPKPPALPFAGEPFPIRVTAPKRLKFGDIDIVSFDSSNAADSQVFNLEEHVERYRSVAALLNERRPTWLVTHRPIWGVVSKSKGAAAGSEPYGFINVTQQAALARVFPDGRLPSNVTAVLAGHVHRFQAIGFGDRRPPQLIVGTAGVELANVEPRPLTPDDKKPILVPRLDGIDAWVVGLMEFGAMVLEPGKAGTWTGAMVSETGRVLAICDSTWPRQGRDQSVCRLQ